MDEDDADGSLSYGHVALNERWRIRENAAPRAGGPDDADEPSQYTYSFKFWRDSEARAKTRVEDRFSFEKRDVRTTRASSPEAIYKRADTFPRAVHRVFWCASLYLLPLLEEKRVRK